MRLPSGNRMPRKVLLKNVNRRDKWMKLILHSVLWKALDIKDPFISVGLLLLDTRVHLYISMLRMLFVSFGVLTAVLPPVEEPMNQVLTQLLLVRQLRF